MLAGWPEDSVKQAQLPVEKIVPLLCSGHGLQLGVDAGSGMTAIEQNDTCTEEIEELLTYYCAAAVRCPKSGADANHAASIGERTPLLAEPRRAIRQECPRVEHIRAHFRWKR